MPLLVGIAWTGGDTASHACARRVAFPHWGLFHFYLLSTAHLLLVLLCVWHEEGNAPRSDTRDNKIRGISDYYVKTSSETLLLNTLSVLSVARGMGLKIDLSPDGTGNLETILLLYI